eukprot:gene13028-biopygen8540
MPPRSKRRLAQGVALQCSQARPHRMRALLGCDDMVLLALSFCPDATLNAMCVASKQD